MENHGSNDSNADGSVGYFSEEAATFGDRVAAGRRAVGLSQESLSHKLGIKLKTLRAWENDMSEPRANRLQMLAGVLNASIIWLLTGEGEGVRDPWEAENFGDGSAGTDRGVEAKNAEMTEVVAEFRIMRGEMKRLCERMVLLEKRLTAAVRR